MPTINFRGKHYVENHHLIVPYSELKPVPENGLSPIPSLNDNVIVHGDNLRALKALLPVYEGRVKCIYIDPPYNTGNEGWQYNDAVNSPFHREWLGQVVGIDDMERHDKWLCMMMPRLKLLRQMLREDGVIFISIDDNEVHHLRLLMDEVFGADNFVANIAWEKRYTRSNNAKLFYSLKDYILVYRRSSELTNLRDPRNDKSDGIYKNPDNDDRGLWTSASYVNPATKEKRPNLVYPIINPFTNTPVEHPTHAWKYEPSEHERHVRENRLWWGKDGNAKYPRLKVFLSESDGGLVPVDFWDYESSGTTDDAGFELKKIFGEMVFDTPKPTKLIKRILKLVTSPTNNDIILDSFAGSGTTAHAVLDLNKEDGGNRKFVLIEMEEYANSLTAERVRRVIAGVPDAKNKRLREGLGGTFSYFELGKPFDIEALFAENNDELPDYINFARLIFYWATGAEFDEARVDRTINYIGESPEHHVFLYYAQDWDYLMNTGLTLDMLKTLPFGGTKKRLVYAPSCFVDDHYLRQYGVEFLRLPYEIYKYKGRRDAN